MNIFLSSTVVLLLALSQLFGAGPPVQKKPPPPTDEIKALVKDLGDDSYQTREKATAKLKKLGYAALGACIEAQKSPDPEVRRRADTVVSEYYNVYYDGKKDEGIPFCPSIWMLDEKHRFPKGAKIVKDEDPPDPSNPNGQTSGAGWCKEMKGYDLSAKYFAKARKAYNDRLKKEELEKGWKVDEDVWINEQIERDAMQMYIQDQLYHGVPREDMQKIVNASAVMCKTHKCMHRHYGGGSLGSVIPGPAVPKDEVPDNSEYRFNGWGYMGHMGP